MQEKDEAHGKLIVSIVTPCRNEVNFIEAFVLSAFNQKTEGFDIEILIADGLSDDGTTGKLKDLAQRFSSLFVVENPGQIVSTGLNAALRRAQGQIVVRMDVHTIYEPNYVVECVKSLRATGAKCVGGPWRAMGVGSRQQAIADAFQSPIGSGGAASRRLDYDGPCDTVYLGCWWAEDLHKLGGFDESLVRNQDDELCLRIKRAGFEIWQSSKIQSRYMPRASFKALFKQFFQYGYWKVAVAKKHRQHAALRHIIPFGFVSLLVLIAVAIPFFGWALVAFAATLSLYWLTLIGAGLAASSSKTVSAVISVAIAIGCMHFGYGLGYGLGVWDFRFKESGFRSDMKTLTR